MSRLVLGLDLGESSIGGALVRLNDEDELDRILWMNSRVFSGIIDSQKKVTLNSQRRIHRGQRKTIQRRARRRQKVEDALVGAGLLPQEKDLRDQVLGRDTAKGDAKFLDPYELRARALSEVLEPFEIGRAIQHLLQRRGFRSNRKAKLADLLGPKSEFKDDEELQQWIHQAAESVDSDGDEGTTLSGSVDESAEEPADSDDPVKTLEAIERLEHRWAKSQLPTIGAYLAQELREGKKVRKKNRLSRQWLEDEFELIWEKQAPHHPALMSDKLKNDLLDAFQQRPLKPFRILLPKRGWAENDLKEELRMTRACAIFGPAKPVARRGHWVSHRFRILETLRNLRLQEGEETRPLKMEEVIPLADRLQKGGAMTWAQIRKEIGNKGKFTIEASQGSLKKLVGNTTEEKLKRILGAKWNDSLALDLQTELEQLEFMQDMETCDDPVKLFKLLQRKKKNGNRIYPLTKRQAFDILSETFPSDTTNYSVRAMRFLIASMLEGKPPHEARGDVKALVRPKGQLDRLPNPPPLRNPRVQRALFELRKVFNALIDGYGMPDVVKIELARELKENKIDRERASKRIKDNERLNEIAANWYRANGRENPTGKDLRKHRHWKQQGETCPYCLKGIGAAQLLEDATDIDHVLPLTRGGDDAFTNKVLAHRECNADKGDRLPFEVWGHEPSAWKDRLEFVKRVGVPGLLKRFELQEVPEDFVARQLADTRYITREAVQFVEQLKDVEVWPTTGGATGFLREKWGLDGLLPRLETKKKIKEQEKNRLDHRHHAIDALVVALTNPKRYRAALVAFRGKREGREIALKSFYRPPVEDIKLALDAAQTSHALNKGIRGALHDASFYGRRDVNGSAIYVRRIGVDALLQPDARKPDFLRTKEFIEERVYDVDLRRALLDRMSQGDWENAFRTPPLRLLDAKGTLMETATVRVRHPKRSDESTINIDMPGSKSKHSRYVAPESNHHAEIIRLPNGKLTHRVVRMIDAARAMRGKVKISPYGLSLQAGEELVMCLGADEIVEYDGSIYRVASTTSDCIWLRSANDARPANDNDPVVVKGLKYARFGKKLTSDPLGNLSPTNAP